MNCRKGRAMTKKKPNNLQKGAVRLVALHLLRKVIVEKEKERVVNRIAGGNKAVTAAAKIVPPALILYRLAGGGKAKVQVKAKKNKDGKVTVKKAELVPKRRGIAPIAAGLVLKGLNRKAGGKKTGIFKK